MFEKVGSDIVKLMDARKPYTANRADGPHRAARTQLAGVHDLDSLLDGLVALDTAVAGWINNEIRQYQMNVPLAGQPDRSQTILDYARLLLAAYQRVLADVPATHAVEASLGGVAGLISLDVASAGGRQEGLIFIRKIRDFVLLTLATAARIRAGQTLVARLQHYQQPISVRLVYKEDPTSLLAFPNGVGTRGTEVLDPDPNASLQERVAGLIPGNGGPSQVAAPVWLTEGASAGTLTTGTWDHLALNEALDRVLIGSLSFARDRNPFYTPPRIEVLHELVHAAHNGAGENREAHNGITNAENAVWSNAEEFWTIAVDNAGENAMATQVLAPDRYGHGGLPLRDLVPGADATQHSLHQHSRI
jgi:hypothetical protein